MSHAPITAYSQIPGVGLSYADLCATARGSEVRTMWHALGDFAEVLGIEPFCGNMTPRTKTIDEFLAEITEVVPDGFDIAAAALATTALTPDPPVWEERFEVRRLTALRFDPATGEDSPTMTYTVAGTATTYDDAQQVKDTLAERAPDAIFAIIRVETVTKVEVFPAGYVQRL